MNGITALPLYDGGPVVGRLGMGTVALGMAYGVGPEARMPSESAATALLTAARQNGVDFFDTAPAYGLAEERTGYALGADTSAVIATKLLLPADLSDMDCAAFVRNSVSTSLVRLRRDRVDVLKIHNATTAVMARRPLIEALQAEVQSGRVTVLGASVYGAEDAHAVLETEGFRVVQIAFSILDQRCRSVFDLARRQGAGLVVRSALLKGALSPRYTHLPPGLAPLRAAVEKIIAAIGCNPEELPGVALRFVLGQGTPVSVVLTGASTTPELADAIEAMKRGPLPPALVAALEGLGLTDERLVNPALWPALS